MKHSFKITIILLAMFFISQLIGIAVNASYSPEVKQETTKTGEIINVSVYDIPYGIEVPEENKPDLNFFSILIAFIIAVLFMLFLIKIKAEIIFRTWFFIVVSIGLGITFTPLFKSISFIHYSSIIALVFGGIIAYGKIFQRNILLHNISEVLVYPGISVIFVPLFNIFFFCLLLILISVYDIYAVWHSGFMQRMAKYQINKVRVFAGFLVPYIGKKEKALLEKINKKKDKSTLKKIKIHMAILGGGDVIFPMILAGIVLQTLGLVQALVIVAGATASLFYLLYVSEKGKFYPAMPFITIGCFIALVIAYLI